LFLLVLFVAAITMRTSLFVNLLYLFSGIYFASKLWSSITLRSIGFERTLTPRAFAGEDVSVSLEIFNRSMLPVVWLRVEDALPIELAASAFKRVIALPSFGKTVFEYQLHTHKRGCFKVGPLRVAGGDLFGLSATRNHSGGEQILVVYPQVYHLPGLSLPSRSPMGSLRTAHPLFEDPTRVRSKRDYVSGDSLRRIDWKSSASSGRLQVKQFEPSIALETMIFLNLNAEEYDLRTRFESTELAITVAASIANWVSGKQQAVGLATNGLDPFASLDTILRDQLTIDPAVRLAETVEGESSPGNDLESLPLQFFKPLMPRKGQLMRILDMLARIQPASTDLLSHKPTNVRRFEPARPTLQSQSFLDLLQIEQYNLPWGTTLVLVTNSAGEDLFNEIFKLRRRGLSVVIVLVGQVAHLGQIRQRAHHFHLPLFHFRTALELDQVTGAAASRIVRAPSVR
jgi:hypothetical protein